MVEAGEKGLYYVLLKEKYANCLLYYVPTENSLEIRYEVVHHYNLVWLHVCGPGTHNL